MQFCIKNEELLLLNTFLKSNLVFFTNLLCQIYNQKRSLGSFYINEIESGRNLLLGLQCWGVCCYHSGRADNAAQQTGCIWLVAQQVDSCTLPLAHAHSHVGSHCKHSDIDLAICHRQWSVWSWLPATILIVVVLHPVPLHRIN